MGCDIGWCRRSWGSGTHTQSPLGGHRLEHFVSNKQHLSLPFFIRLQINHFTSSKFLIWWKKMKIKLCFHRGLAGRIGPGVPSGPSCWFFVFLLPLENTTFGVIKRDFHHYMSTLIEHRPVFVILSSIRPVFLRGWRNKRNLLFVFVWRRLCKHYPLPGSRRPRLECLEKFKEKLEYHDEKKYARVDGWVR
jgi:hypothetical protein